LLTIDKNMWVGAEARTYVKMGKSGTSAHTPSQVGPGFRGPGKCTTRDSGYIVRAEARTHLLEKPKEHRYRDV
jgi:hypothetical protein